MRVPLSAVCPQAQYTTAGRRFGDTIEYYLAPGCQHKTWPWIFPKRDVVTLGTGGYMTSELFDAAHPDLDSYMERFMDLPPVASRIHDGRIEAWGVHLEFDEELDAHAKNGLILAGEAGGFVTPFLGEGMPESFFTGIYAAQAAAAGIKADDLSGRFLEKELAAKLDENLFLKSFMYVASKNKASILSKPDEEIAAMVQSVDLFVIIPVADGVPGDMTEGKAENAQVIYEMSSDTFLAIHRKEITGMQAFMKKLVKVKASMPDLLKLQKLDSI